MMELDFRANVKALYQSETRGLSPRALQALSCFFAERVIVHVDASSRLPAPFPELLAKAWKIAEGESLREDDTEVWESRVRPILSRLLKEGPRDLRTAAEAVFRAYYFHTDPDGVLLNAAGSLYSHPVHEKSGKVWIPGPDPSKWDPEIRREHEFNLRAIERLRKAPPEAVGRALLAPLLEFGPAAPDVPAPTESRARAGGGNAPPEDPPGAIKKRLLEICNDREFKALFGGSVTDYRNDTGHLVSKGYKAARRAIEDHPAGSDSRNYLATLIPLLEQVRDGEVRDEFEDPDCWGVGAVNSILGAVRKELSRLGAAE